MCFCFFFLCVCLCVVYEMIVQDVDGIVTVVESSRHDLEDGDVVRITEVQGMTEVNGKEFKITVKGFIAFSFFFFNFFLPLF